MCFSHGPSAWWRWGRYDMIHSEASCYSLWPQGTENHCKDSSELSHSSTLLLDCPLSISLRLFLASYQERKRLRTQLLSVSDPVMWTSHRTSGLTTVDGPATDSCTPAVCLTSLCSQGRKTGMLKILSPVLYQTFRIRKNHVLKAPVSHHWLWKSSRQPA